MFYKVLPTFVKELIQIVQKVARADGVMDLTCLRSRVSLLVWFYKIIFKERVNSFSKTRKSFSFYLFCCGTLYHFKHKIPLLDSENSDILNDLKYNARTITEDDGERIRLLLPRNS